MPEPLFTVEDSKNWNLVYKAIDELTKPIEKAECRTYIQSFAAAYHFAFGGKEDRDAAIANWNAELIHYPEWAVRQTLGYLRKNFKGDKPLTPAVAVEILEIYTKDFYKMRNHMRDISSEIKIFASEEELAEYKQARKNVQS